MLPRVCSAIDHWWRPPLPSPSPLPKVKRKRGNVYENLASVSPLGGRVRLHVGYRSRRLRLINPTETLIILDITIKLSLIIVLLYIERKKKMSGQYVELIINSKRVKIYKSASNTKRANLTWLPLESCTVVLHDTITQLIIECSWHDCYSICS